MYTKKIAIFSLFIIIIQYSFAQDRMKIGDVYLGKTDSLSLIFLPTHYMTARHVRMVNDGILYDLGLTRGNKIIYISTSDQCFTVEKYHIGDILLKNKHPEPIEFIPVWGYFTHINSEWKVGLKKKSKNKFVITNFYKYDKSREFELYDDEDYKYWFKIFGDIQSGDI